MGGARCATGEVCHWRGVPLALPVLESPVLPALPPIRRFTKPGSDGNSQALAKPVAHRLSRPTIRSVAPARRSFVPPGAIRTRPRRLALGVFRLSWRYRTVPAEFSPAPGGLPEPAISSICRAERMSSTSTSSRRRQVSRAGFLPKKDFKIFSSVLEKRLTHVLVSVILLTVEANRVSMRPVPVGFSWNTIPGRVGRGGHKGGLFIPQGALMRVTRRRFLATSAAAGGARAVHGEQKGSHE